MDLVHLQICEENLWPSQYGDPFFTISLQAILCHLERGFLPKLGCASEFTDLCEKYRFPDTEIASPGMGKGIMVLIAPQVSRILIHA